MGSRRPQSYLRARAALFALAIVVGPLLMPMPAAAATTTTFSANGSWTVPAGVTSATFEVWGGQGGAGASGAAGGKGGHVKGTATVTPGDTYTVTVGPAGGAGSGATGGTSSQSASNEPGGSGGSTNSGGGAGGGGSSIANSGNAVALFAGGGGGGGGLASGKTGGSGGGGTSGASAATAGGNSTGLAGDGGGAGTTTGGAAGAGEDGGGSGTAGVCASGSTGAGGTGGAASGPSGAGGGGGGGYCGGGGGGGGGFGDVGSGGGGGSGFVSASITVVVQEAGVNSGSGSVTVTYTASSTSSGGGPSKQQQFITAMTFDPTVDHFAGEAPTTLIGTASSSLPVGFTVFGACSLSAGPPVVISFPSSGTCQLIATQPGNDSYLSATPVVSTFTVKIYRAMSATSPLTCAADPTAGTADLTFVPALHGYHSQWASQDAFPVVRVNQPFDWCLRLRNNGDTPWLAGARSTQVAIGSNSARDNTYAVDHGVIVSNIYDGNRFAVQLEPIVVPGKYATFLIHLQAPSVSSKWRIDMEPVVDGVSWLEDNGIYVLFDAR